MSKKNTPQADYTYENDRVSTFLALLLSSVALLALYFVCADFDRQPSSASASFEYETLKNTDTSMLKQNPSKAVEAPLGALINAGPEMVFIEGIKEVGEPISFTIPHFSPEAEYQIDLGDGQLITVKDKTSVHKYSQPADYQVNVHVTYKGKRKLISSTKLVIFDAIEMKASVKEFQF